MRSFEYDYLLETPISHLQAMTLRELYDGSGVAFLVFAKLEE